ncbi:GNAT family protein [Emcibacter sp.]|uniref:GNAT family N-acetyltransferase n=1 Tax=Emcibacter sp. TaxID=1979954 RepID=UPI002AA945D8|nr:GNAT family protein [Emcibacter sp.]
MTDTPQEEDIFLQGEIVCLRQPDIQKDVLDGHWHNWFNDQEITRHLIHGVFPVNKNQQAKYVQTEIDNPSSLLLVAIEKKSGRHIGIVCLKDINQILRSASLSIVFGERDVRGAALEAVALMSKHGFDRLNLQRIQAGQNTSLWRWMNSLELIGYQIEGYHQHYGVRDGKPYDTVTYAITSERFYALQKKRGGNICMGSIDKLYAMKSTENRTEVVRRFFEDLYSRQEE